MAKRKAKNKSFASKRAAEANVAQRQQSIRSTSQTLIFGIVGLAVVLIGGYFLVQFLNQPAETEPAAVESGSGESVEAGAVEVAGSVVEADRPLAAIAPVERNNFYSEPPEMVIDTAKNYQARIQTDQGDMVIQLFDDQAPVTVNNFVYLANQGFYDDLIFHRVIDQFMAQGGDPTGTGAGGPGYAFEDEFDPSLRFDRSGLLAMANSGPATNGSQFFITFAPTDWLNDAHTIFGELIEGDDTLGSIPITGEPGSPTKIIKIEILES
ncbi:MAG: peptidylprolyl isomerase [Chloroflexota bacterium]